MYFVGKGVLKTKNGVVASGEKIPEGALTCQKTIKSYKESGVIVDKIVDKAPKPVKKEGKK